MIQGAKILIFFFSAISLAAKLFEFGPDFRFGSCSMDTKQQEIVNIKRIMQKTCRRLLSLATCATARKAKNNCFVSTLRPLCIKNALYLFAIAVKNALYLFAIAIALVHQGCRL